MPRTPHRGRPKGSTRYAKIDEEILTKVAELIADAKPPLKPTAAMRQLGHHDGSVHRRLQRKWRIVGTELQEKVRAQKCVPASAPNRVSGGGSYRCGDGSGLGAAYGTGATGRLLEDMDRAQRMMDMIDPPHLRRMREVMEREQRLQDLIDPPGSRMVREMLERERRLQKLVNPPLLRTLGRTW